MGAIEIEKGMKLGMTDIIICIGSSCHLRGSRDIVTILEKLVANNNLKDKLNLRGSFCMGECQNGVCVQFQGKKYALTPSTAEKFFNETVLPAVRG